MSAQFPNMKICPERFTQLKQLRDAMKTRTIAGTVGELISAEIARGTIRDEIPGVEIRGDGERVFITIADHEPKELSNDQAKALAEAVADLSEVASASGMEINPHSGFVVQRKGASVAVQLDPISGSSKVFPTDLARDFARLVRKAATD